MSFSQPSPPDPYEVANAQSGYNKQAAIEQAQLNAVNQVTPYGTLNYTTTPGANGIPQYTATQNLSPEQQQLLTQYQGTQAGFGNTVSNLAGNTASMYSSAPDFTSASSPLVQSQMEAFNAYMQPTYTMQRSNLESQLQNQGIPQGSQAWDNAMRSFQTSQDQAAQSALMQFEPQAFNQAVTTYETPLSTMASLFGASAPQGVQQPFVNAPSESIQPPNYASLAEQNYGQQLQQYQNTMSGLFGLGGAGLNALAAFA